MDLSSLVIRRLCGARWSVFFLRRGSTYEVLGSHERQTRSKAYGCGHDPPRRRAFIMFRASHCLRRTLSRWVRELQYSISWRKESRGNSVENSCRDCGQYVYWIIMAETYPQQIGETVWKKVLLLNLRESLIDKNEVEWCSLYYPRERNPFDVSFLFKFRQLRNLCSKEGFVVWD